MIIPVTAVVGTGFIGPVHVEALRRLGVRVHGILGSTPEKSIAAADRFEIDCAYRDFAALLADPEINVVHLASPNHLHHTQALAALAAGKHIVCEKPLALTVDESAELVDASVARPRQVCAVNYNLRFYPLMLHARALARSGELGEILHVQGSYLQDWLLYPGDFNWRVLAPMGGELRAVGDIGTHWLDLARFVTGLEYEAVMADLQTVHLTRQRPLGGGAAETFAGRDDHRAFESVAIATEDYGSLLLRFSHGVKGACTISQVAAGRKNCLRLEICGTKRSLAWDSESPEELWLGERGQPSRLLQRDPTLLAPEAARLASYPGGHAEGFPDTFKHLYAEIYADIARGIASSAPLYATFADGHREIQLCAAIAESHRRGGWVSLPH